MSKAKFTQDDVRRAVAGILAAGGSIGTIEICPDGRIVVTIAMTQEQTRQQPKGLRDLI